MFGIKAEVQREKQLYYLSDILGVLESIERSMNVIAGKVEDLADTVANIPSK